MPLRSRFIALVIAVMSLGASIAGAQTVRVGSAGGSGSVAILSSGSGSPEGVVIGKPGDQYYCLSSCSGHITWTKETGTGTNTGWVAHDSSSLGNSFFAVSGPASTVKTFTFPNASATVLTTNAVVTADQGGTGQSTYTKGDLLASPGSNTLNKLGVGGDGQVLTADTASTNGVKWTTVGSGGGGGIGDVSHTGTLTAGELIVGNGSADITALSVPIPPQGRLTLTTATPVTTTDVTAATMVYYTPTTGSIVPIYNGSVWTLKTFTELSQATTDATKSPAATSTYGNYDVFVWNDSGTLRATRGPEWTFAQTFTVTLATPAVFSATGHGLKVGTPVVFTTTGALPTGLTGGTTYFVIAAGFTANDFEVSATQGGTAINTSGSQSGTHTATEHSIRRGTGAGTTELDTTTFPYTNKNAITNGPGANLGTYVGTVRTDSASKAEDSVAHRMVWNAFNRRLRPLEIFDGTDSWTYGSAAWRQANNTATNHQVDYVSGLSEDLVLCRVFVTSNGGIGVAGSVGIGVDHTTTNSAQIFQETSAGANAGNWGMQSAYRGYPGIGYHMLAWLEYARAGTITFNGDTGVVDQQSGIIAEVLQ